MTLTVAGAYGGGGGHYGGWNEDPGDFSNDFSNSFLSSSDISLSTAIHYRAIHGILASVAIVALMPIGSIFIRLIPGRFAIWAHALTQVLGYLMFAAGASLGIYLVSQVNIPFGGSLLTNSATNTHPIMGIVVLGTLFFQPILGYIHHVRFKKLGHRTLWSHVHLWNGRLSIILGIITGGLGLRLASAPRSYKIAYGVVAGILGCLWLLTALWSELRRRRSAVALVRKEAAVKRSLSARSAKQPKESMESAQSGKFA